MPTISQQTPRALQFRVLGPLEARVGGRLLRFAGGKQRSLLCALLIRANETVSTDSLVDALWPGGAPARAVNAVQVHVSGLRKLFGPAAGRLETHRTGYVLTVEPGELDRDRFVELLGDGRSAAAAADHARAAELLRDAGALWVGDPLADVRYEPFAQAEIARLEELRLAAHEERIEADLALGRHGAVVAELEALVAEHPLRERLRGQLMLALYRGGRQAEALSAYQDARRALVDELGIDPSPPLRALEAAILRHDEALVLKPEPSEPVRLKPTPPPAPAVGRAPGGARAPDAVRLAARKVVTVLFCDLADSATLAERLDPEALRGVISRYFATAAGVIERHGGTVEKFIGDAVMAVFGIPRLHEDDALRAVRAAVELREALVPLDADLERVWGIRLAVRIGVNTGEVIVGGTGVDPLVTGEAVAIAARLEQAATPGQILLGETTHLLVRDAVTTAAPQRIPAKSRRAPVHALKLEGLAPPGVLSRVSHTGPLVGRTEELEALRGFFSSVAADRCVRVVTVVGAAGIGKSRLAAELAGGLGEEAAVLAGRCLPYGEGMTFWPVLEILRRAAELDEDRPLDDVLAALTPLLADEPDAARILSLLGQLLGQEGGHATTEETFWALRRFFEVIARGRPLIVVIEDVHWAEPTLLDLLEYVRDWSYGTPLLLLCLARPELLERRPTWTRVRGTDTVVLDPLTDDEASELLRALPGGTEVAGTARAAIVEAADGNPLFLEQTLSLVSDHGAVGGEKIAVPPTIQALLAARLDDLLPEERVVIERAAVIGRTFTWEAVRHLLPETARANVGQQLASLVRKELVAPHRLPGELEHALRFRHILIREAAYAGMPKRVRADLHTQIAERLEGAGSEKDELVGYHLEQAVRYRVELGILDEPARKLASAAGARLASAGRRALARGDVQAAAKLLERATSLNEIGGESRADVYLDLGIALRETGTLGRAGTVLETALELADDDSLRARVSLELSLLQALNDPAVAAATLHEAGMRAVELLGSGGDDQGLARAWRHVALAHWTLCHAVPMEEALGRALAHAERAGNDWEAGQVMYLLATAVGLGPSPVGEALGRCGELRQRAAGSEVLEAWIDVVRAVLEAMRGDVEVARDLYRSSSERIADRGLNQTLAGIHMYAGMAELVAGDPPDAEGEFRMGYAILDRMGDRLYRSTMAAFLARSLARQGRDEEAETFSLVSSRTAVEDDLASQAIWRGTQARILARRGEMRAAEQLARDAAARVRASDLLSMQADTLCDLEEVLRHVGRMDEAQAAANEALALYERKGNVASAASLHASVREIARVDQDRMR